MSACEVQKLILISV